MKVGPNAKAVVDRLPGRPAAIIAAESDRTQATFRALFNGAVSPGQTDGNARLECQHADANAGWPGAWSRLQELGLIRVGLKQQAGKVIKVSQSLSSWAIVQWEITPKGWEVRMDDIAWMHEYLAADASDKATKQ
jgi:hypothetical protein